MKTNIRYLFLSILILTILACQVPTAYVTFTPTGAPKPTQTAVLTELTDNMCLEFISPATLYSDTLGHWKNISYVNMPKGTRFIYSGARDDDYVFVLYGEEQGWVLVNYVKECQ